MALCSVAYDTVLVTSLQHHKEETEIYLRCYIPLVCYMLVLKILNAKEIGRSRKVYGTLHLCISLSNEYHPSLFSSISLL